MKLSRNIFSLLFFISIMSGTFFAQGNRCIISGYVLDKDTQEPLIGVNVFVSGTLWGASTDENGYFQINTQFIN